MTLTPIKAIRAKCIDCSGHVLKEVRNCCFDDCPLHPVRMGRGSRSNMERIRAYCLWCNKGQRHEARFCPAVTCPLWEYRFGKRPAKPLVLPEIVTTETLLKVKSEEEEVAVY
jgi:hypothetical protein